MVDINRIKEIFKLGTKFFVYEHCKIVDVYDGDTVTIMIDLGLDIYKQQKVRLINIDTPEIRSRSLTEKQAGKLIRDFVKSLFIDIKEFTFISIKWDKYGNRLVGDIVINGQSLSQILLNKGYAKPFTGKTKKEPWKETELKLIVNELEIK